MGSLVAFSGATLVLLSQSASPNHAAHAMTGNIAGLLGSIAWGIYPVLTAPLLKRYSSLKITAWSAMFGVIPLLTLGHWQSAPLAQTLSPDTWLALAFSIFIVTIYGLVAWYVGVGRVGPTQVMVYMYLIPVVAIAFAAFFIQETVHISQLIGGVIIFTGIAIVKHVSVPSRAKTTV